MLIPNHIKGLEKVHNENILWINIEKPTREKMDIIAHRFALHELNIEDCLSKNQLPKIDRYDDHIFIILQFPTTQKEKTFQRFSQLSLFVGKNFLITINQGDLKPLVEQFQACKSDDLTIKQNIMGNSTGYLLHSVLDSLVDDLVHILMKIIGNIDDIEDAVFDDKVAVVKEITTLRREITTLRRVMLPLKRIMVEITSRDVKKFSSKAEEDDLISYYDDVNDHIFKVLEALEEAKETIEIYKDTDFMLSTEKTNKILGFLTILFTFSIPITVIGTFFGMNMRIPFTTNASNIILDYVPMTIVIIVSIGSVIVMIWLFKKLGWMDQLT
ncbi:MAG: magnesium transporter CorA family protein [Thermoproteota archaeon]|nr:magnesium transporter CorA family protein [Thermoproteota archaeon]